MGTYQTQEADLAFIRGLLPDTYSVSPTAHPAIRCFSRTGLVHNGDADDDEAWGYIKAALQQHFGPRLKEIDFKTNAFYSDFYLHLRIPPTDVWHEGPCQFGFFYDMVGDTVSMTSKPTENIVTVHSKDAQTGHWNDLSFTKEQIGFLKHLLNSVDVGK